MVLKLTAIAGLAFASGTLFAQGPAFEVATIKPSAPMTAIAMKLMSGQGHVGLRVEGDRVDIVSMSLSGLIQAAYKVKPYQVTGPGWISDQRFDVVAKMPEGAVPDQVPEMLQALLAERFKLTIRRESREHPLYALVVARGGSKLIPATTPEADPAVSPGDAKNGFGIDTPNGRMSVSIDPKAGGAVISNPRTGKMRMSMGPDRTMIMDAERMTMGALAEQLSSFVDRPVLDLTDLKDAYQVKLELSLDNLMQAAKAQGFQMPMLGPGRSDAGANTASDPSGSSVFESLQKLGLKLEPCKMPMDTIVVDSAEKTSADN
jgi:uncharacterized protein (TIGR03435 family)